ncbi:hypothetical protein [Sinomicrobium weinanense]|uniref:Uncharacterized protein n=1 Tax=Sinomicrobium weinanense TaxID=2842200 RepID=A0A926JQF3_9FLAO|nr:hypothetical protein [Sinomicrobium weinanense]MBC9795351.1 hypothetical protein [Sinomicrobium weinanense]MBU3122934.1 hypothetical protein [Sinomicrobium weinanense]
MKNTTMDNRVEIELSRWLSREQRFQKLFSFSLNANRDFIKEKLRFYRRVSSKYKGQLTPQESLTLRMMRQERRHLEKQLYPNVWVRLAYKAISRMVRGAQIARDQQRQTTNIEQLKDSIRKMGFPEVALQREQLANKEKISIPLSYQVGKKEQMQFDLVLKQGSKGYELAGYTASLHRQEGNPSRIKHYFKAAGENTVTAEQAHNLLSGRSVMKGNGDNRHWMQLDFNDRNAQGNYNIKRFYPGYGFDLEKTLRKLPLKELGNKAETKELVRDLKNGKRRTVTLVQGNKQHHITIEANPRFKSLNLYNTKGQKIALDKNGNRLLGQKKGLQRKVRLRKGLVGKDRMRIKRN